MAILVLYILHMADATWAPQRQAVSTGHVCLKVHLGNSALVK